LATAEFIAFHANERPDAAAFVADAGAITYRAFAEDIGRLVRALAELGIARGNLVAVGADDAYLHCLLLIAIEAMGAVSASFSPREGESCRPLLARADLVLAEPHFPLIGARRHRILTPQWLQEARTLPRLDDLAACAVAAESPVRLTRTSGTTGAMKLLLLPRRQHESRLQRYALAHQFTERSRYLLTMSLVSFPAYGAAMACLRSGGALVRDPPPGLSPPEALSKHGITDVTAMPLHLKHILDLLPEDFAKPERLTVYVFGGPISGALRERALARLATTVYASYGTNEAGFIAIARSGDGNGGSVWPDVEVEVVDESDAPLPPGATGRIRVRSEFMVEGYLDDPEATRRMFRDGWFYPGDSGVLEGPRRLRVLGRTDDLLNIGGVKWPPEALEGLVARDPAVQDVGICSLENAEGFGELWVLVVAGGLGDRDLWACVSGALAVHQFGHINVVRLDAMPRNEAGKIRRDRLRSLAEEARRGRR